ncbi:uncharacterized protein SPPG_02251 [Spizellomyces punctatus DAOM BR117]|uniref:P-loop containing nucleoside triphosphate hydrolase protein n=1 Tax=Spizellomyces punctatus (strain DAOM BR117) TaxID=645134 RepID=A0A0L0HQU1_SPIPD|nr:uncharacterized protein SPPG_02251 [Spizellomyces punctatus DAOM BR117]KND03194.1 hypothetical protein SPPG_02251 [Spizellomyces punctatus DAOM BR117]|eukprot:XP_016611233.1 hypothetical protein SPPG_02251 [Spizellomyces punctatus DAOM BR117]
MAKLHGLARTLRKSSTSAAILTLDMTQSVSGLYSGASKTSANVPVTLRPYQIDCIEKSLDMLEKGTKRQACAYIYVGGPASLPVGSGKTTIFSHLVPRIPAPNPKATKTLLLAHRTELIQQAKDTLKSSNPQLKVDLDEAKRTADMDSDVIIASVATLGRSETNGGKSKRLLRYDPSLFKAIIIDEAHHAAARSYQRILEHFGAHKSETNVFVWGCSATVRRHDGLGLTNAFDGVVCHRDIIDMINEGWLCDMKVESVSTDTSLDGIATGYGDFVVNQLAEKVDNPARNNLVVRQYINVRDNENRRSTLVFAANVQHVKNLERLFQESGINAKGVHGGTPAFERRNLMQDFKAQKFPVLINCGIVTEGVDIPAIDCVILARPTQSSVLLQQMLGRGLRTYPGKTHCLVIDMADVMSSRARMATVPSLIGLDPAFDLEGLSLKEAVPKLQKWRKDVPSILDKATSFSEAQELARMQNKDPTELWYKPFDNPFDVANLDEEAWELNQLSRHAWVRVGPKECALAFPQKYYIVISQKKNGQNFQAVKHHTRVLVGKGKGGGPLFVTRKDLILEHDTLSYAIRATDTYVRRMRLSKCVLRTADWRKKPASAAQIQVLKKFKIQAPKKGWRTITKGQAADLITRRRLGGLGKSEDVIRKRRKEEKAKQRLDPLHGVVDTVSKSF